MRIRHLAVASFLAAGLAGCVPPPPGPHYPPVPPLRSEMRPPPPRAELVWEPGNWHWNGGAYEWVPGHYTERRWTPEARFVPGHWVDRRGQAVWEPAHWQ